MSDVEYEITTNNIFEDLGLAQSEELLARARLMQKVALLIKTSKKSQHEIAQILGVSQPKISMLVSGKLSAFSTETLFHYLIRLGCTIEIRVRKTRTRIRSRRRKGSIAVS
jgi:predicted XRE-type DNA-binding protein